MTIQLSKRAETVGIILSKKGIDKPPAMRVGFAVDSSGSMEYLYNNGTVAQAMQQLMGVALNFDDNGEMEVWSFNESAQQLPNGTANNYDHYSTYLPYANGGTEFAPAIRKIITEYFPPNKPVQAQKTSDEVHRVGWVARLLGKQDRIIPGKVIPSIPVKDEEKPIPVIMFFQTDGENQDETATLDIMRANAHLPIYWQFIGVGNTHFKLLEKLAGSMPNVGLINMSTLNVDDKVLYDLIINDKLIKWIKTK